MNSSAREVSPRRRWVRPVVALILMLLAGGIMGMGKPSPSRHATDALAAGSQSAKVAELRAQLPEQQGAMAIVLFASDAPLPREAMGVFAKKAAELTGSAKAPVIPAKDQTAVMVPVTLSGESASQLRDQVRDLRRTASTGLPAGVTAQVTGPAAIQGDLAAVFDGANVTLLGATALVVGLVLILTYRSPLLWLIPLLVVGVADQLAAIVAPRALNALNLAWDESTTGILSVLVFGAGTDYALLLIARYRDELRRRESRFEAMGVAVRATVEPVVASATTVFLGLLTLALSIFPATRGLGVACAVGVVIAAVFVLLVLPGALVIFPRWIFWPKVPRVGDTSAVDAQSIWTRIGSLVRRIPGRIVVVALALLAVCSVGLGFMKIGLPEDEQFLRKPEAIVGAERLARSYPAGTSDPVRIVTTPAHVADVMATAKGVEGVDSVRPAAASATLAEVQVVLDAATGTPEAERSVKALRAALDADDTYVGGSQAQRMDVADGQARDRLVIFPIVLALVLVALMVLLRSVVAPLVLVGTVVATYAAALGAAWWVFTGPMGFSALDGTVPMYAFVFLVALGVDYNIFLVTRAKEEAVERGTREGMLRALTVTGGVITSAGVVLAAVFAVLGVLPLVALAQLGVVIFIGVLLDTLLVRTVVVPALATLLGERFWWPRKVSR